MPFSSLAIKNVGSYDNTGQTIPNLKKLNFFFGYNGTGKSTIVRYLCNLSMDVSVRGESYKDCSEQGYDPLHEQILVYDEKFKKENFLDRDSVKGVFYLNQQNAEIDKKIKEFEEKIRQTQVLEQQRIINVQNEDSKIESKFNDVRNKCFLIRNELKAFSKIVLPYSNSKTIHYNKVAEYLQNITTAPTIDELSKRYKLLYDSELKQIGIVPNLNNYNILLQLEDRLNHLLNKIIIGHQDVDVATLIQELNNSSWVQQGVHYLKKSNGICPFCQQDITNLTTLEKHFNDFFDQSYNDDINLIKTLQIQYKESYLNLKSSLNKLADHALLNEKCRSLIYALDKVCGNVLDIIEDKLESPNEKKHITSLAVLSSDFSALKTDIVINDENYINQESLRKQFIEDCYARIAIDSKKIVDKFEKEKKYKETVIDPRFEKERREHESSINDYKTEINNLRRQTVNTQEAVNNINIILSNSGFKDFIIEEIPSTIDGITEYRLHRNSTSSSDNVYQSLSEGEKTFIAFLYFYQLCIGTDDLLNNAGKKKILVIDDPVSSLDNKILFIISSIIHKLDLFKQDRSDQNTSAKRFRNEFKNDNISQIFIFTHNMYFYKEITLENRNFCRDCNYYHINKPSIWTEICEVDKPIATDDYTLMWKTLKKYSNQSIVDEGIKIMICNVMRRIIDSYVEFQGLKNGNPTWSSINSLNTNDPKYIVASSFISLINDDSHGVSPLDCTSYSNIVRSDISLIYDSFKLIFDNLGPDHYTRMME